MINKIVAQLIKSRHFNIMSVITTGLLCFSFTISGCSSGGGSSSLDTTSDAAIAKMADYTMPTEISAVPVSSSSTAKSLAKANSFKSALKSLAKAATDAGTDYSNAETRKFVEENSLKQFEILETVLNALSQTNYNDTSNINKDPYKCIVAWEEEDEGINKKTLETWVVESTIIEESSATVLRARAWIEEVEDDGTSSIAKAEFKVYSPPTKEADGSYSDYGIWTLNVKFDATGTDDFFAASASKDANGAAVLKIHEKFSESFGMSDSADFVMDMKAVMYRSVDTGYGKVYHPDFKQLFAPGTDPGSFTALPHVTVKYAYNPDYLAVQVAQNDAKYKDRNDLVEMTHRYGVFSSETGDNLEKSKSFGFPIKYAVNSSNRHSYYGSWQGRHQLWIDGDGTVAEGTTVYREDTPPGQDPEQYTIGKTFNGVLAKRNYITATLNDIKNIPVEIWINNDYNLVYNGGKWHYCTEVNWATMLCNTTLQDFDDKIGLKSLIVGENDNKKNVEINGWDQSLQENVSFVYELANELNNNIAGFYKAQRVETQGSPPRLVAASPRVNITTLSITQLFVWMGGSIYVEYKATGTTGWVEKEVTSFDTMTWTPTFNDAGDKDYLLPEGKELYVNMQGANYVVKRTGANYSVQLELQTVCNPNNATTIVPGGTTFYNQWNPDSSSTYEFITDPNSEKYLMLVYKTIGDNDKDASGTGTVSVGDVVGNIWGITNAANGSGDAFNWEYSSNGGWGSVTYLKNSDGTYKILDDPVRFDPITVTNAGGEDKTVSLQFDGWMMGLPELHHELEKSNWVMTDDIKNKIINLPAGTSLIDLNNDKEYLLKPLEISQFLSLVPASTAGLPDITQADTINIEDVPDFVEHNMGDMPTVLTTKYSEGNLVE